MSPLIDAFASASEFFQYLILLIAAAAAVWCLWHMNFLAAFGFLALGGFLAFVVPLLVVCPVWIRVVTLIAALGLHMFLRTTGKPGAATPEGASKQQ